MSKIKKGVASLIFSYLSVWNSSKSPLIYLLLIKISLGFIPVLGVWLIERFFNSITSSISTNEVSLFVYLFLIMIAITNFLTFALNSTSNIVSKVMNFRFEAYMKKNLLTNSKNIPFINYENSEFQNQYIRVLSSQGTILNLVESTLLLIQTSISLVTIVIYLVNVDSFFISVLIFMVLPLMIIEMRYGKERYNLSVDLTEPQRISSYFESLLLKRETIKEIRLNMIEDTFINKWSKTFSENTLRSIKMDTKQVKWLVASNIILVISFIVSGGYVYQLIFQGVLTIGVLAAVIQAIQSLQGIVPNLTSTVAHLYESSLFVEDYRKFIPTFQNVEGKVKMKNQVETIQANNLSFKYPGQSNNILQNIDLTVNRNDKVAIMGKNGSGKTTLIKCLIGLYETDKRIILNDDYYLEDIFKEDYWRNISVLFQDFNKYDLSVKDNISNLNKMKNDEKGIIEAAKAVGLHEYISSLPFKYETTLGVMFKEGEELSGGQWQKIALARSIYKKANFLFLDEPTSALDPNSEYYIIDNLLRNIQDSAVIYITHRINVAMLADKIIIMDSGKVIEEGSHEVLIRKKGVYYDLYKKQLDYLKKEEGGVSIG